MVMAVAGLALVLLLALFVFRVTRIEAGHVGVEITWPAASAALRKFDPHGMGGL